MVIKTLTPRAIWPYLHTVAPPVYMNSFIAQRIVPLFIVPTAKKGISYSQRCDLSWEKLHFFSGHLVINFSLSSNQHPQCSVTGH